MKHEHFISWNAQNFFQDWTGVVSDKFWSFLHSLVIVCFPQVQDPPYFSARMLLLKDCKDVVEGWKAGDFVFLLSCKSICLTDCMNLLNFSGAIQCTGWGSGDAFVMEPICHYPWDRWHCWDTSQQHVCFALNQLYGNFSFPDWLAAVPMILLSDHYTCIDLVEKNSSFQYLLTCDWKWVITVCWRWWVWIWAATGSQQQPCQFKTWKLWRCRIVGHTGMQAMRFSCTATHIPPGTEHFN